LKALNSQYTYEDLESNELLSAVLCEVLRIIPSVALLFARKVVKPMTLCGVKVNKGDTIMPIPIASCSRDDIFPNPTKFDPNRFIKGATSDFEGNPCIYPIVPRNIFLPFSAGSRNCLGQYLGEMMVKIVVTELLREFKFDVVDKDWKPVFKFDPLYGVTNCDLIL
jgi:cytochrome P450